MNLLQCVESLSTNTLKRILTTYYPDRDFTREEDRNLLFLLEPKAIEGIWERLSTVEQYLLGFYLLQPPSKPVPLKTIQQEMETPYPFLIAALTRLRQMGILYTHRFYYGEPQYFMPSDLRVAIMRMLNRVEEGELSPVDGVSSPPRLIRELYSLVEYVRRNPLPLTQKGLIHKRQVQRMEEELGLTDGSIPDSFDFHWDEEAYSPSLSLLLDFAAEEELLLTNGERMTVNEEALLAFLEEKADVLGEKAIAFLRSRLYLFEHLIHGIFLDWLLLYPRGKWVPLSYFYQYFLRIRRELTLPPSAVVEEIIRPLQTLIGLIFREKGEETEVALPVFHMKETSSFYLQPNFQFLVPEETSLKARHRLSLIAKVKERGQMVIYEISKESVAYALEQGLDQEEILQLLEELSLSVPENVRQTVAEWVRTHGQIRFYDCIALVCESERLAYELENNPAFARLMVGKLAPTVIAVRRGEVKTLRQKLINAGYSPFSKVIRPGGEEEEEAFYPLPPLFRRPKEKDLRVENLFPEWKEVASWISLFPRSWFMEYRSYREEAMADLLSKSVQYQVPLRLGLKAGEEIDPFYPLKILKIKGRFMLRGVDGEEEYREKEYGLDEIERVQGFIPEELLSILTGGK